MLCFPGPASATGEDIVEFHCHGGRAVVAAVEAVLATQPGLRRAEAGEFTRRALTNGRIDLLEAEGLADLLEAETEAQRTAAIAAVGGSFSTRTRLWLNDVAALSAQVEVLLDYADDDDAGAEAAALSSVLAEMDKQRGEIEVALAAPSVERLRDGVRVVIAGPPNSGKSTLLNLLSERDAAIVSPVSGTTRDRIEAPVTRNGLAIVLIDTAGLTTTSDIIEAIGVSRAEAAIEEADVLVWLGDDVPPRDDAIRVHARSDLPDRAVIPVEAQVAIAAGDAASVARLWAIIARRSGALLGHADGPPAMRERQRSACKRAADALRIHTSDAVLIAEALALARRSLAELLGVDATAAMLDALFGRFCLGK